MAGGVREGLRDLADAVRLRPLDEVAPLLGYVRDPGDRSPQRREGTKNQPDRNIYQIDSHRGYPARPKKAEIALSSSRRSASPLLLAQIKACSLWSRLEKSTVPVLSR